MSIKTDRHLSIVVIALLVLLIGGGFVVIYKIRNSNVADLSPTVVLQPVPPTPHRLMLAAHEFRGECDFCHPVTHNLPSLANLAGGLPRKQFGADPSWSVPVLSENPVGQGYSISPGWRRFPEGRRAALTESPGAPVAARTGQMTDILTPAEQNAAGKMMVEGHWLGMETLDLTPALRKVYQVPAEVNGVIIDEVSLEAAEVGFLAGDIITKIQGRPTATLDDFFKATIRVNTRKRAEVTVYRLGRVKRIVLSAQNSPMLGFAQMESASPIRPGALSPHKSRNVPCTNCHLIMVTGGQLPVDAGDITPTVPPIFRNASAPHRYRGPCNSCHRIIM